MFVCHLVSLQAWNAFLPIFYSYLVYHLSFNIKFRTYLCLETAQKLRHQTTSIFKSRPCTTAGFLPVMRVPATLGVNQHQPYGCGKLWFFDVFSHAAISKRFADARCQAKFFFGIFSDTL